MELAGREMRLGRYRRAAYIYATCWGISTALPGRFGPANIGARRPCSIAIG